MGTRVRIRNVSESEAEALQEDHGGFNSSMRLLLGREGVVSSEVDSDGDCIVTVDGESEEDYNWNSALLEATAEVRTTSFSHNSYKLLILYLYLNFVLNF